MIYLVRNPLGSGKARIIPELKVELTRRIGARIIPFLAERASGLSAGKSRGFSGSFAGIMQNRGIAQSGSAPALGAGCREFESLYPDQIIGRLFQVIARD
jgi:hypothetical protein